MKRRDRVLLVATGTLVALLLWTWVCVSIAGNEAGSEVLGFLSQVALVPFAFCLGRASALSKWWNRP